MILRQPNKAVETILDKLTAPDLQVMLQSYARMDKDFLFYILCSHVRLLEDEAEQEKYEYLFFKILQHYVPGNKRALIKKSRKVVKFYRILWEQAKDLFAIENYRTCFYILKPGITFLKLLAKRTDENKDVMSVYEDYHVLLGQLINTNIPPPLRQEIQSFCIEQSCTYDYIPPAPEFNLYNFSFRLIKEENNIEDYINDLTELMDDTRVDPERKNFVVRLMLTQSIKWKAWGIVDKMLKQGMVRADDVLQIIPELDDSDPETATTFAEYAYKYARGRSKLSILSYMLDEATASNSKTLFSKVVDLYFSTYKDLKFFTSHHLENGISDEFRAILVKKAKPKKQKATYRIHYYYLKGDQDAILAELDKIDKIDRILKHLDFISKDKHKELTAILFKKMSDIANTYFGPKVSGKFEKTFKMLKEGGYPKIADKLASQLMESFAERSSLVKTLDEV